MMAAAAEPAVDPETLHAELYDAFAHTHPRYRETSQTLVALAGDLRDADVVDLGCGTGIATRALLNASDGRARVVALDASDAMLARARHNIGEPHVRFVCERAERLDHAVGTRVDCVVSNAAIWHMDAQAVANAIGNALRPAGVFAFNFAGSRAAPSGLHAQMRAIALQRGIRIGRARALQSRPRLQTALRAAGLTVARAQATTVMETAQSRLEFLRLPGSTYRTLPQVPYPERMRILELALQRVGHPQAQPVRWTHVRMVKPS